jgi:hypothetical protein
MSHEEMFAEIEVAAVNLFYQYQSMRVLIPGTRHRDARQLLWLITSSQFDEANSQSSGKQWLWVARPL